MSTPGDYIASLQLNLTGIREPNPVAQESNGAFNRLTVSLRFDGAIKHCLTITQISNDVKV
jgi:hypothetical protein